MAAASSSPGGRATRSTGTGTDTGTGAGRAAVGCAGAETNRLAYCPAVGLALLALLFRLLRPAYPVVSPTKGVVVVTGTSSGIGNAIATELVAKGYHVLAGVRRQASFDAWKRVNNPKIAPLRLDVRIPSVIQAVVKTVEKERKMHGLKLAGVVGNAGLGFHMPIEQHSMADVRRLFEVNFFGNVALAQAFVPIVREDHSRIVFISSLAGRITQPKQVFRALSDSRPKTRYTATNFMMVPTWLAIRAKWLLPDRIFDKIVYSIRSCRKRKAIVRVWAV